MKHLGVECNPAEQGTNTIIDHINKKCLIIQNNWSIDKDDDTGKQSTIKIFEGDLPSRRQRVEGEKLSSPLNHYLATIFEETGGFVSSLMVHSAFKNVIRDLEMIHFFYKDKSGKQDHKAMHIEIDDQGRGKLEYLNGNFIQISKKQYETMKSY